MIRYLRPDSDLDAVIGQAVAAGRRVFVVDAGDRLRSSIARFADVLRLPEWFGGNLDALYDALGDFRAGAEEPTTIVWDRIRSLRRADPRGYEAILAVLEEVDDLRADLDIYVVQR